MPYTPPAQLSPAASKPTSPAPSRSQSYLKGQHLSPETQAPSSRPNLPRSSGSSSYLNKHRRSPSLNEAGKEILHNGEAYGENGSFDPHGSLRQSPPPLNHSLIPTGMTISPPESAQNSSDDEDTRGRSRDLEVENLRELQAAIRVIEQRKEGSPDRKQDPSKKSPPAMDLFIPQRQPHDDADAIQGPESPRPPLSREARKISHSRSSTDSNIVFDASQTVQSPVAFRQDSSEDEDSDGPPSLSRPPMVRKKSGELVRPALRPPSRRRPSSMPGTPTYSKAVHFDSHLEHVRHFLQVDRPLAVSAGSSPVEAYESESEFPFGSDESSTRTRAAPFEWEIRLANFPVEPDIRKNLPVHVERIFLSSDNKNLIGSIAVQNLAFQKLVVTRFTLDYWKTTSEVVADFNQDVRRKQNHDGLDRFNFNIKLADQANLESKTLFFCVRYNVNGQEYWDNNSGYNYQVDFSKKPKPQNGKNGMPGLGARPLNALPRSRPSPPTSSNGRPKSMPVSFDDFTTGLDANFGSFAQPAGILIGEPKIKLRSPRSKSELVPDAPARRNKPSAQAFGNRYDFNSSLTAARNNAFAILGVDSGFSSRADTKQSSREVPAGAAPKSVSVAPSQQVNGVTGVKAAPPSAPAGTPMTFKPAALVSEKPPLTSQSYQELVDKYCFFGTHRSPQPLTRSALSLMDGANDHSAASDMSTTSTRSSKSSGSITPTPTRGMSPSPPSELSSLKAFSPQVSRSPSPMPRAGSCLSSRSASPVSFGYPYHSSSHFMSDAHTSTAIRG